MQPQPSAPEFAEIPLVFPLVAVHDMYQLQNQLGTV